jgi:hypothetical protein
MDKACRALYDFKGGGTKHFPNSLCISCYCVRIECLQGVN